jgi:hypothetical protein
MNSILLIIEIHKGIIALIMTKKIQLTSKLFTYTFTAPSFNNPIYFMADTYPENTIDTTCYSAASGGFPTMNMTVSTLGS